MILKCTFQWHLVPLLVFYPHFMCYVFSSIACGKSVFTSVLKNITRIITLYIVFLLSAGLMCKEFKYVSKQKVDVVE